MIILVESPEAPVKQRIYLLIIITLNSSHKLMQKHSLLLLALLFIFPTVSLADGVDKFIARGNEYTAAGNHKKAFNSYWQAFKERPGDVSINYLLGLSAVEIKNYEAAVMAFERVIITDPNAIQAKIELAKAFYKLGSTETAKQYFIEVIESDVPEDVRLKIKSFIEKNQ